MGKDGHMALHLSNKTAHIIGKNLQVYNQVQGQQGHSSITANVTLVELQLVRYATVI